MSEIKKINELSVAEYMNVISNPQAADLSAQDNAILGKFKAATKSHYLYCTANGWNSKEWIIHKPRDISYAWGSFNAILVVFQYLNDDRKNVEKALSLTALFNRFVNDTEVNDPRYNKKISGERSSWFVFRAEKHVFTHTAATFKTEVEVQGTDNSPDAYRDNFNIILGSCTKDSSISTVLRHLESSVRPEAMAGFREMARRGFGTDLSITPSPLWTKCEQLYDAGARQIVFTGAPGTGKTYTAGVFAKYKLQEYADRNPNKCGEQSLDGHIEIVQFHSSYDYSDFVEGLRPVETGNNDEVTFRRLDGQFKAFCRKILADKDCNAPYFFIIDEINRADLSRVFGELMFCLDESKRPVSLLDTEGKMVTTQYSNLPTYEVSKETGKASPILNDVYQDGFYIPKNLCILATMNDIDRSIETFDFALRRRFKWIEAKANDEMKYGLQGMLGNRFSDNGRIDTFAENVIAMNNVIAGEEKSDGESLRLTTAYHIGHAYFEKYTGDNLQVIWDTQIEQILREYCRGRSKASQVEAFIKNCHDKLFGIETEN